MGDELEVPVDPASLVLAVGDDVNPNRPLYTGDVIAGIRLPVLEPTPMTAVIRSHPCSMRKGADLDSHLHVAPVVGHSESGRQMWHGNFSRTALDAIADSVGLVNPVVRLDRMTLVESSDLDIELRLVCLDRYGVNVLCQRLVYFFTRVAVNVTVFDQQSAGAHEEVDLLESWIDRAATLVRRLSMRRRRSIGGFELTRDTSG